MKLNRIEILISKALINSYISRDVLKKYDDMKEKRKNLKTSAVYQRC